MPLPNPNICSRIQHKQQITLPIYPCRYHLRLKFSLLLELDEFLIIFKSIQRDLATAISRELSQHELHRVCERTNNLYLVSNDASASLFTGSRR